MWNAPQAKTGIIVLTEEGVTDQLSFKLCNGHMKQRLKKLRTGHERCLGVGGGGGMRGNEGEMRKRRSGNEQP